MNETTKVLIDSLRAVSSHAEPVANALMLNRITPEKQREYADMLEELSTLLREYADTCDRKPGNG
jgi:hypothetical protein